MIISLQYLKNQVTNDNHQLFELNKKYDLFHHFRYLSESWRGKNNNKNNFLT